MKIEVRLFADAREATGREVEVLELGEGARAEDAFDALVARYPRLAALRGQVRFAVGEGFVEAGQALLDGQTLALIPPVGGG